MKACAFCAGLSAKTVREDEWRATHAAHLVATEFEHERFDHPSGTWAWLVCPCGARLLTVGEHLDEIAR